MVSLRRLKRNFTLQNTIYLGLFAFCIFYIYKYVLELPFDTNSSDELSKNKEPIDSIIVKEEKRETEKIEYESEAKCGNKKPCVKGQYAFSLSSGGTKDKKTISPMCFNGVSTSQKVGRGMNVIIVDEKNGKIISEDIFDLWAENSDHFVQFLDGVKTGHVLVITTYDEASKLLSDHARDILRDDFGSKYIGELGYRGSWAFIGQKGVKHKGYYEKVTKRQNTQYWGDTVVLKGCAILPLSEATELAEVIEDEPAEGGNELKEKPEKSGGICGVEDCQPQTIAVHVQSSWVDGKTKNFPVICVEGKAYIYKDGGTGKAGRGLNVVVFNPDTKKVVTSTVFDTYESDTDDRSITALLNSVDENHFVIITTHDEATNKLSFDTMAAVRSLGSKHINSLGFRSSWAFIGQKMLQGNSPYELVGEVDDGGWGSKVEIHECIPVKMKKVETETDDVIGVSKKKIDFCKKYDGYGEFCKENLEVPLLPVALDDASLKSNLAYSTPIIIVSGPDLSDLQRTMDSVLKIPGLNNKMVVVVIEESFEESTSLVQLYNFRIEHVKTATTFAGMMHKTMRLTMSLNYFKNKNKFIMIEERIEVSPDLLRYYSQTLHLMDEDKSIFTVSAWNEFGFASTSSDPSLLYRTELFIGYVWVLQRPIWDKEIRDKEGPCCNRPTWQGWFLGDLMKGREVICPDVSRLTKRLQDGFYVDKHEIEAYHEDRIATKDANQEPTFAMKLVKAAYEEELKNLLHMSSPVDKGVLEMCITTGTTTLNMMNIGQDDDSKNVFSIFYEADSEGKALKKLCKCFHLYVHRDTTVRNIHNGIVRFTIDRNIYLLVGSTSEYFKLKPAEVSVFEANS
ncbi:protein O-linked-mannose beta-1,2-N-acetylglucosaminyltransferase 1-like [Anneissia japonica]|uniref:protein O-linked-mannose beta-1,2-N-acetylglucosaminyltransferase 1-like n=1 Tax=Anneissia japonica TaxID=1529436 RepID=UPI0014257A7F|nr:protein O-linked-mannose beta-1,2-N-acetylglucosaminyltransferase 1-like [Anneissia japonica]